LELKDKIIKRFKRIFEIKTFEKTSDWKHDALLIFLQEKLRFFPPNSKGGGALWSYFPNKANKWKIRKHEKKIKKC
jgi:hypothetical protein